MGQGGRAATDGMDAYGFAWCAFGRAPDSEQVESELPVTVTLSQHWKDSCGPGLHRGGSGGVQQWMIHKVPELVSMCMGNGSKVPLGQPLFGGYASAPIPGISVRKTDLLKQMQRRKSAAHAGSSATCSKRARFTAIGISNWSRARRKFTKRAICFLDSAAAARATAIRWSAIRHEVLEDLRKQIISDWTAQNIYRIAYDPRAAQARPRKNQATARRRATGAARARKIVRRISERNGTRRARRRTFCSGMARGPTRSRLGPVFRP